MPIWAAIVAGCSLPFIFHPFFDRKEWKYIPQNDIKERETLHYFKKKHHEAESLQSADLLTTIPL